MNMYVYIHTGVCVCVCVCVNTISPHEMSKHNQFTHNVNLKRVRVTIVAVEKQ